MELFPDVIGSLNIVHIDKFVDMDCFQLNALWDCIDYFTVKYIVYRGCYGATTI